MEARGVNEQRGSDVRGEAFAGIHASDLLAERLGDIARIEQSADGHRYRDGEEAPADVECVRDSEQRGHLRRVVQPACKARRTPAEEVERVERACAMVGEQAHGFKQQEHERTCDDGEQGAEQERADEGI